MLRNLLAKMAKNRTVQCLSVAHILDVDLILLFFWARKSLKGFSLFIKANATVFQQAAKAPDPELQVRADWLLARDDG